MTKVISFINRKGGTAKTTSAINVATTLKKMGFGVTLIETDDNYSLAELRELELSDDEVRMTDEELKPGGAAGNSCTAGKGANDFPDLLRTGQENAAALISALRMNLVDMVVVDGAANMSAKSSAAIAAESDIVVIPTDISDSEIMVTGKTIDDLRMTNDELKSKIIILPNRIHFLTSPDRIERSLARLRVPVMDIYIPYFKMYKLLSTVTPAGTYRKVTGRLLKLLDPSQSKTAARTMEAV